MKSTGIVRKVDDVGRLVLPKELRDNMDLDCVEIFTENNAVILKKYQSSCVFCGAEKRLEEFRGRMICRSCIEEIYAKK